MKNALLKILSVILMTLSFGFSAQAAGEGNEFQFRFEMTASKDLSTRAPSKERFEYRTVASTWEEAFKTAAQACYRHFKNGKALTEDQGLDIIDVCANPRRI